MNWKNEAMERLRQYRGAQCARGLLPDQILALETKLYGPGAPRLEPGGRGNGSREDWQLNALMGLQELRGRLAQTEQWLTLTDKALNALEGEEREILKTLYIEARPGGVEDLCQSLSAERSTVYRRRDKALEQFTIALYGPLQ